MNPNVRARARERVLTALVQVSRDRGGVPDIPPGWRGGKTAGDLAGELGLHIGTVRRILRQAGKEGLAVACAPRSFSRSDGKTANTLLWFGLRGNAGS